MCAFIFAFGFAFLFLFFFSLVKHPKYGINLKRVHCPNCGLAQPYSRIPKNKRQAMYGGNTCSKCDTEMDKFGKEITE